ncbi:putative transcriptional regulatory protein C139.03-like protein 14, partial [Colletotrichum chlorophyti]
SERECLLPPPGPPRKQRRRNYHELYDHLARLESLLEQRIAPLQSTESGELCTSSTIKSGLPAHCQPVEGPSATHRTQLQGCKGKLISTWDGDVEFRDSKTSAAMFEDVQTIRALNDVESEQAIWLPYLLPAFNKDRQGYAHISSLTSQTGSWIPSANEFVVLWRVFLDRVDPVTKLIHVPTFHSRVVDAIANFSSVPLATQALLFSIFLTASGSLSNQEHQEMFGCGKAAAIANFVRGVKEALTLMNYLKNCNVEALRSLTLYSLFQQTQHGASDPWVLNGLVVNIAQRLGLHRDGSRTGLSPFEAEMRRRLWWQIVVLETRSGGDVDIGTYLLPSRQDARVPLNVNDEVLDPTTADAPNSHDGPTEMSFCVLAYETQKSVLSHPPVPSIDDVLWSQGNSPPYSFAGGSRQEFRASSIAALQGLLKDSETILGPRVEQLCPNAAINPLHAMARSNHQMLLKLIREIITPMEEVPEWGTEVHGPDDNFFRIALAANELALETKQAAGRRFAWYANIDFKIQTLYYLSSQLQIRVSGSMVSRAWVIIEKTYGFHEELWDCTDKRNMMLANLVLVAWKKRAEYFTALQTVLQDPLFLNRLQNEVMMVKTEALSLF